MLVDIGTTSEFRGTATLTSRLKLVNGLKLEVLVVHLTEDSILIVSSFTINSIERCLDGKHGQFSWILDLNKAMFFIIFENRLADTGPEESSIWED